MDYYRVPEYSRKEIVMTINTPNPSTSTTVPTTPSVPTTKSEAGELIANFKERLSKGYCIPKEYNTLAGIKENIPAIVKAVKTAFAYTIIKLILTGDYPQLKNLKKDGDCAIDNVKVVIATFTNNKDEVTINDLIELLKYGSYDCHLDKYGRIAATLLYITLYK